MSNIQQLRTAAIVGMIAGHTGMIAYARALPNDVEALKPERDLFMAEAKSAGFSESSCKSLWSSVARIATGQADGDPAASTLSGVAYASQTPAAKAAKAAAAGKEPKTKSKPTPMGLVAAFMQLSPSERKETLTMLNALPK